MAVVNPTGIVVPVAVMRRAHYSLTAVYALSLSAAGDLVGPISFSWGTTFTCFFRANIVSTTNVPRLLENSSGQGILFTGTSIKITLVSAGGTVASAQSTPNVLLLNQWHDYAIVFDGQYMRVYRNGIPADNQSLVGEPDTTSKAYTIFNRTAGDRNCTMAIYEFQWYNRPFSPIEIVGHYNSDPNNNAGLVFRYKLHEGSGSDILDSSKNNLNTKLTGGLWSMLSNAANPNTYGDINLPARSTVENRTSATNRVSL